MSAKSDEFPSSFQDIKEKPKLHRPTDGQCENSGGVGGGEGIKIKEEKSLHREI